MRPLEGTTVVIGAQWGDEGKGKVVDALAANSHAVVRFNGGANAGHTVETDGSKFILHLLPSGLARRQTLNIVGPGVVCDPEILVQELELARQFGSQVSLDRQAPVILPLHKQIDQVREARNGNSAIGTTLRGIGPCYEDFAARRGLTLQDLTKHVGDVREALLARGFYQERSAQLRHYGAAPTPLDDLVAWCARFRDLGQYLQDTRAVVHKLLERKARVLFEGAQGVMLDAYLGTRPYCTSSCCTPAGVAATMGVHKFDRVIGVAKAYATRVGAGPFPTEIQGELANKLRERGHEYGSTTGRPRRVGWLDLAALRYACRVGGITELVITKLDVLTSLCDPLQVCTYYDNGQGPLNPKVLRSLTTSELERVKPALAQTPSWISDLLSRRSFDELPSPVQAYLGCIEEQTGVPVVGVGVGPDRNAIIWRE